MTDAPKNFWEFWHEHPVLVVFFVLGALSLLTPDHWSCG